MRQVLVAVKGRERLAGDVRMARRGIPRVPSPRVALGIPARVRKLPAPLGTSIAIERTVGVIGPRPSAPTSCEQ